MGVSESEGSISGQFDKSQKVMSRVAENFRNPDHTTFVAVCIPEFLSLYETERLIQELFKNDIDCHNIVVNQLLYMGECECVASFPPPFLPQFKGNPSLCGEERRPSGESVFPGVT